MNTPTTQGAETLAPPFSSKIQPTFYQLSWENWTDGEGSFHKKILGKLHQIKASEDGTAIAAQNFFLAGKDASGHDLFIARELSEANRPAPSTFSGNYLSVLSSAGEYHPVDVSNCARMIDLAGKEKTLTKGYQILAAQQVSLDSLTSADGVYVLQWMDWNTAYVLSPKSHLFSLGTTSNNVPIYACRGLLDASKPEGGYAIGTYLEGGSAANIPVKEAALPRTSFQLLQAIPLALYLGEGFTLSNPEASASVPADSRRILTKRKTTAVTSQFIRNSMGALMSAVVYQATSYNPTASDPDTPSVKAFHPIPAPIVVEPPTPYNSVLKMPRW